MIGWKGGLAPTPLPYHRACGSAYGGSTGTLESLLFAQQREEPQVREVGCGRSMIHVGRTGVPPRTATVAGMPRAVLGIQAQGHELALPMRTNRTASSLNSRVYDRRPCFSCFSTEHRRLDYLT